MNATSFIIMSLVIGFLVAILFYQANLIKKLSKSDSVNGVLNESENIKDSVLIAVITAAISHHKIQNSQRQ